MLNIPNLTIVVAMDRNNVIGKNGDIPWAGKLRGDMEHFKNYTTGKIVVMGRKTYESIPERFRPLSNRENLILTRNRNADFPGCGMVFEPSAIIGISASREVCIVGGAEIYALFLPVVRKMIVTEVDIEVEGGDTFFPRIMPEWKKVLVHKQEVNERNHFPFSIYNYERPHP